MKQMLTQPADLNEFSENHLFPPASICISLRLSSVSQTILLIYTTVPRWSIGSASPSPLQSVVGVGVLILYLPYPSNKMSFSQNFPKYVLSCFFSISLFSFPIDFLKHSNKCLSLTLFQVLLIEYLTQEKGTSATSQAIVICPILNPGECTSVIQSLALFVFRLHLHFICLVCEYTQSWLTINTLKEGSIPYTLACLQFYHRSNSLIAGDPQILVNCYAETGTWPNLSVLW